MQYIGWWKDIKSKRSENNKYKKYHKGDKPAVNTHEHEQAQQEFCRSQYYCKEKQLKLLGEIHEDSQWLIRMVENLLSVTRIDSGAVKLIKTPTALEELIDSVVLKFKKRYPEQQVYINIPEAHKANPF